MSILDRPIVGRIVSEAEQRFGLKVADAGAWKAMEQEFGELRDLASDLAWGVMDWYSGRPQDLELQHRRRLAQRSRQALLEDPLIGGEAQLLSDFAFGKGVSIPQARDPQVQDVIDEGWKDPINQQTLFSFMSQVRLSNELKCCGELFPTVYEKSGRVRFGRLDADQVINVVTDPDQRLIPLFYVARERKIEWNYEIDAPDVKQATSPMGVKYWAHWQNVDEAVRSRETDPDAEPLDLPPPEKLAAGKVYHVAINQTGESIRGNPPWARSLRFASAMNVLTEAHVTMAQAASTFIARRAMRGSPNQITKAASQVLAAAGELGATTGRVLGRPEPTTQPFTAPGTSPPMPPGSWWQENMDTSKLEALNLSSGAAQMAQTAQIVRAPIAASSGFGQHYLGDATSANLATASTLELPATQRIASHQEIFEGMYRWATDRMIEAAVRAGRLGGAEGFPDQRRLSDMSLAEAADRAEMEKRTKKDLSYEFSMPFPGRRQLVDVVQLVQTVSQSQDPNGVNVPLRRILLRFLFEQMGIDDVAHAIEECLPEKGMAGGIGPQPDAAFSGGGAPPGGAPGGTGARYGAAAAEPGEGQQPYGAKSGTAAGGGSAGEGGALEAEELPPELIASLEAEAERLFRELVEEPTLKGVLGNGASPDGTA